VAITIKIVPSAAVQSLAAAQEKAAAAVATPVAVSAPPEPAPIAVASEKAAEAGSTFLAALAGKAEAPLPWEADESYTIMEALKEHFDRSRKGETLYLRNRTTGQMFLVKGYNSDDGRALLESPEKATLKPVITKREVPLYEPFWRS